MKRKIIWLVWTIIILFLMNAATLGAIFYHNSKEGQSRSGDYNSVASSFSGNVINGGFLRRTLGFKDNQMAVFQRANRKFRPQTMALVSNIDSLKAAMFAEMNKQKPDTVKLAALSTEIGEGHRQLKQKTCEFYLKLKSVCTEQQQSQLEKTFEPLFRSDLALRFHGLQRGGNRANN